MKPPVPAKPKKAWSQSNVLYSFIPNKVDEDRDDLDNTPRLERARVKVTSITGKKKIYYNVRLLITPLVDRNCAVRMWLQGQCITYKKFKVLKFKEVPWS